MDTYYFCVFLPILSQSLRKKYGSVFSMKVGSFKLVVAEDVDSVKEVLVKRSADYAGRPPFHSFVITTLGMCCIKYIRIFKLLFNFK